MTTDARRASVAAGALAAVGGAAAASLAWGALVERRMYALRRASIPVLPRGAQPIRVLHLSDLHMAPWQHGKQEWIRMLAALEPDLIVDTGDNLGHREGLTGVRRALDAFRGVPGVFVHGSNDYFAPKPKNPLKYFVAPSNKPVADAARLDTVALEAYFAELGWLDLNNAAGALEVNGTRLEFFGVDDPHRRFDRPELISGALDELREAASDDEVEGEDSQVVTIGVAHAPYRRILDSFVTHGAQVIFAGHTHGGQICVPGVGALVTNCDLPRDRVKGLSLWRHALSSAYLNVSAGLGTSIYAPVRFACRPEASLIMLIPEV